jgi:hypothetical protein
MLAPSIFLEKIDDLHGDWPREQLVQMDNLFTAAVERAFELGLESHAAAAATYTTKGKQRADELAIELAWRWFRDAKFGATAVEVLAHCPGVAPARVREGIRRRLMEVALGEVRGQ